MVIELSALVVAVAITLICVYYILKFFSQTLIYPALYQHQSEWIPYFDGQEEIKDTLYNMQQLQNKSLHEIKIQTSLDDVLSKSNLKFIGNHVSKNKQCDALDIQNKNVYVAYILGGNGYKYDDIQSSVKNMDAGSSPFHEINTIVDTIAPKGDNNVVIKTPHYCCTDAVDDEKLATELFDRVKKDKKDFLDGKKFTAILCGVSLGGAIATLAAAKLSNDTEVEYKLVCNDAPKSIAEVCYKKFKIPKFISAALLRQYHLCFDAETALKRLNKEDTYLICGHNDPVLGKEAALGSDALNKDIKDINVIMYKSGHQGCDRNKFNELNQNKNPIQCTGGIFNKS